MANSMSYARWSLEPYCIGLKLRTLRTRKRLTLARLAAETGLSTALLSKLETDRMIPTLATLAQICRVYGVGLSYFFQEPESHTLSITRRANLQGSSRGPELVRHIPLNSLVSGARLAVELIEIPPSAACCSSEVGRASCGVVYVIEGRLRLDVGGTHEVLEAGDCAYMESRFTATWSAMGQHRCRLLSVTPTLRPAEE
jgi:transcriptional regulator with XRE-family HTH domain